MASLAGPLLNSAARAALAALGRAAAAGGGAAAAGEAVKRTKQIDEAKDAPVAQTASTTSERKACEKCPPDCGQLAAVNHSMNEGPREYQARITGFPPGFEWKWSGLDFDGFQSGMCLLQEAKADYDQFLLKDGRPIWFFEGFEDMKNQAIKQSAVAVPKNIVSLSWYFMTPKTHRLMRDYLLSLVITPIYAP